MNRFLTNPNPAAPYWTGSTGSDRRHWVLMPPSWRISPEKMRTLIHDNPECAGVHSTLRKQREEREYISKHILSKNKTSANTHRRLNGFSFTNRLSDSGGLEGKNVKAEWYRVFDIQLYAF